MIVKSTAWLRAKSRCIGVENKVNFDYLTAIYCEHFYFPPLQFSRQEWSVWSSFQNIQYQKMGVGPMHSFGKIKLRRIWIGVMISKQYVWHFLMMLLNSIKFKGTSTRKIIIINNKYRKINGDTSDDRFFPFSPFSGYFTVKKKRNR